MLKNPLYMYGPRNMEIPANINFSEFVLDKMLLYGDREAIINGATDEILTYKQIAQDAITFAVSLSNMGVRKGHTVAICSENRSEFWGAAVGIMCTGAVLTTFSSSYTTDEIKHVLNITKPKHVVCSPQTYKVYQKVFKQLDFVKKIFIFGDNAPAHTLLYKDYISSKINPEDFIVAEVKGQTDTAVVLYSSGTTGFPKGVMLTHHNLLMVCNMSGKDPDLPVSVLSVAPWYHAMGLISTFSSFVGGRKIVYLPRFQEKLYIETIQKYRVNVLLIMPPIAVILSKSKILQDYDVSSVLYIYSGAAPLDADTVEEVKKRFPNAMAFLQAYGMTETSLGVTSDQEGGAKPGSVGPVTSNGSIVKVVDVETRKPLGPNQPGEICIKGPLIMKGYVGTSTRDDFDEEGFYKSGDIGYYDNDRYFFIIDRLKELIKYKGYQVPPAEIEAVLLQHPAVADAAVVGLPNKMAGELPYAFIVKRTSTDVQAKDIVNYIASKLSNPKHLRGGVSFIDQIPKTPSGKILRRELKNMLKNKKSKL